MRCINNHYKKYQYNPPFDKKTETDATNLIRNQAKFEKTPDKREPLHDRVIIKMYELSKEDNRYGFCRGAWLWTRLDCFGGFRRQEFVMNRKNEIQFYVMPDGTLVVRAFTLKNFVFFDEDTIRMDIQVSLAERERVYSLGMVYDVRKNRINNQMISFNGEK